MQHSIGPKINEADRKRALKSVGFIGTLGTRERKALSLRYGIAPYSFCHTYRFIADSLEDTMSRAVAKHIVARALRRMYARWLKHQGTFNVETTMPGYMDGPEDRDDMDWDEVLREAVQQDRARVMTFTEAVGKLMRHSVRCPHCDGEVII